MRFTEEQEYPAIMRTFDLSHGAARKALHTAIRRLRAQMQAIAPELFDGAGGGDLGGG